MNLYNSKDLWQGQGARYCKIKSIKGSCYYKQLEMQGYEDHGLKHI